MRRSLVVIVALEALAALQIAYYFRRLPLTVASHFDIAGMPNGWQSRQMFASTYIIVLVGIAAIYFIVPRLLFAIPPELVHVPNKNYWLAPQHRTETLEYLTDHFAILGAGTVAFFVAAFQFVIQANLRAAPLPSAVTVLLGIFFLFVIVWSVVFFAHFRRT